MYQLFPPQLKCTPQVDQIEEWEEGIAGHLCNGETGNPLLLSDPVASICSDLPLLSSNTLQPPSRNLQPSSRNLQPPSSLLVTAQGCDKLYDVSEASPHRIHSTYWPVILGVQLAQFWSFVFLGSVRNVLNTPREYSRCLGFLLPASSLVPWLRNFLRSSPRKWRKSAAIVTILERGT
jgi:hypothetical protein